MNDRLFRIGVLGASGYTGAELLRFLVQHPHVEIACLTAGRNAGQPLASVFPQFLPYNLPDLVSNESLDWAQLKLDAVFCALPHGTTQPLVASVRLKSPSTRIIDLSADFRLHAPEAYAHWYGAAHTEPSLLQTSVYGLVEANRAALKDAFLIANPGCYPTASLLPLLPLVKANMLDTGDLVIDAKSGVSGAGREAKVSSLYCEVAEGFHAYGVGHHRHMGELDQELSREAGCAVSPSFTPHLVPMNRGMLATIYAAAHVSAEQVHAELTRTYQAEPFVHVLSFGQTPQTRHVRGSNHVFIGVVADRRPNRVILISTIDNLVKGASGQAIQNMNLCLGLPETLGLEYAGVLP
jgi:N-acetyl-gamma-glutamyl-phosphate reductase